MENFEIKGKRIIEKMNGHEVVVIVPEKVDFEEGKKQLVDLLRDS